MNAGLSLTTRFHCTAMVAFLHRYSFESLPPLLGHRGCSETNQNKEARRWHSVSLLRSSPGSSFDSWEPSGFFPLSATASFRGNVTAIVPLSYPLNFNQGNRYDNQDLSKSDWW
jgi:hypothetical protein